MKYPSPWLSFRRDERGVIAVTYAVALIPLMMLTAAAIEYSRVNQLKTQLQRSVDAGALAGWRSAASKSPATADNVFNANIGAASGPLTNTQAAWTTNADGSFTGSASADFATTLLPIIGIKSIHLTATATVAAGTSGGSSGAGVCVLALGAGGQSGLTVNSNVTINGPSCEIDDAATTPGAASFNAGDNFNVAKICVAGAGVNQNGGAIFALSTGCATAADPFGGTLTAPQTTPCTVTDTNYSGNVTLFPGVYCGNFNFNSPAGTLYLSPGTYVFVNTRWNLNSGWSLSGTGVTIYFADANSFIQVNSGVNVSLSAPAAGAGYGMPGVLMYEPAGLPQSWNAIDGSNSTTGVSLSGLIYLPSRNLNFNSGVNVTSQAITMIVNQLILDPQTWTIAPASQYTISAAGSGGVASSSGPRLIR